MERLISENFHKFMEENEDLIVRIAKENSAQDSNGKWHLPKEGTCDE